MAFPEMDDSQKKKQGEEGERKVNSVLKKFLPDEEYHLIEDVTLRFNEGDEVTSAQTDHMIVSRYGIFVIETKHWSPTTIANPKYSDTPGNQNKRQIRALKQRVDIDSENIFPVVAMIQISSPSKNSPEEIISLPEGMVPLEKLVAEIKSKTAVVFDEQRVIDIFAAIERCREAPGKQTDEEHIGRLKKRKRNNGLKNSRIEKEAEFAKSNQTKNLIKAGAIIVILLVLFSGVLFYLNSRWNINNITPLLKENIQPAPPNKGAYIDADAGVFRAQFMQQLAQYESEIEPKINEIQLNNWGGEKYAELEQLKARAIEDFSKGDYLPAREGLQQARAMAAQASAEYVSRLATARREAKEAFENNRAPEAGKAIQQALRLSPADSEMLALQKRVGVLSQVLDLLRQAGVAQNENRPEKEVVALQKVLSIDPSRDQIKSRLQKLRAQLKQQQFSSVLSKAQSALDAGNLADAKKQITVAKTIFPASKALAPLQNRLQQMQAEREFAEQISRGEQAVQRDDWQVAAKSFGRARQLKPNDKTAIENHDSAQEIANITQKISQMLAREHRLGDKNILDSASAYLREVEPVVGASPGLRKSHAELARKVDLYKTEVDVVVVSDNATYIIVRGEGQVGKTLRRTIRLRPGKRIFEGSRAGYKSKLVTLDIKPGTPSLEVTIICDEKI